MKQALVVGLARSGIAAAQLLLEQGWTVRLSDQKSLEALSEHAQMLLDHPNVEWRLGEAAQTLLDGMELVVISPGVPISHPVVAEAAKRGIELIGEMELASRFLQGKLIAITGTNGKTTTTTLLGEILKNAGRRTWVAGNIGVPLSGIAMETRPEDVTVCEVSSFQLETIREFHPDVSSILNITEDHLNRHGTMENYIAHKAKVFMNQGADDGVVLNWDDPVLRGMAGKPACNIVWFSRVQAPPFGAFVRGDVIVYGTPDEFRPICSVAEASIPGAHNLENALAATAVAMTLNVPAPVIRHTLRTFKGVEHRIEFVREVDGIRYINDSKGTNVDSTIKAIETMSRPTVILLGGSRKQVSMLPLAQAMKGSNITGAVLIGDTAPEIEKALDEVGFSEYRRAGYDFTKAVYMARDMAQPGGNVLLSPACASFDMFKDYEERGAIFKNIVNGM